MATRIWTIGHSTREIDNFISLLGETGIKLVVYVRNLPGSKRYPQFNKEALADSLRQHGIRYEHFSELGGRRKPKKDSPNTAWRNASFRGYADHMETEEFRKGVERLIDLTKEVGPAVTAIALTRLARVETSTASEDRSHVRGKDRHRSGRAEWRRGRGDRLSLRSAPASARPSPSLSSWPRPWRRLLPFLFHPQQ
jgi:uncharacterized protein (DUF488 family)